MRIADRIRGRMAEAVFMKRWTRHGSLLVLAVTLSVGTAAVSAVRQGQVQVLKPERLPDGVRLGTRTGFLTLRVISGRDCSRDVRAHP